MIVKISGLIARSVFTSLKCSIIAQSQITVAVFPHILVEYYELPALIWRYSVGFLSNRKGISRFLSSSITV